MLGLNSVAKFIVPDWGDIVNSGCRTGLPAYLAWRAGTTTICQSQLYPPGSGTMNLATGLLQHMRRRSDAIARKMNILEEVQ
jgi:hypothetical protein